MFGDTLQTNGRLQTDKLLRDFGDFLPRPTQLKLTQLKTVISVAMDVKVDYVAY